MITEQYKYLSDSYIDQETNKFMVSIDKIEPYKDNPRYPYETDFKNPVFRDFVMNIFRAGRINHTPIRVYYQNERWFLIEGHRRLEALKTINSFLKEDWENSIDDVEEPSYIKYAYATKEPVPTNDLSVRLEMLSQDSTSSNWDQVKRFQFFCDTYDMFPKELKTDKTAIKELTGLSISLLNIYFTFMKIPILKKTILENTKFSKSGVVDIVKQCLSTSKKLPSLRPELVRNMTKFPPDSDKALNAVCSIVIKKAEHLSRKKKLGQINVGASTALRNFEETLLVDNNNTDADVKKFLTSNTNMWIEKLSLNYHNAHRYSETRCYDTSVKLYKRPREKNEKQAMKDAYDYQKTADFWNDKAAIERKYAEKIRNK